MSQARASIAKTGTSEDGRPRIVPVTEHLTYGSLGSCARILLAAGQPVELHTTGRKSGERRSTMLTAAIYEEDRAVLMASKGGSSDHPHWYKNLRANPEIELTINDRTRLMRARTGSPEEKAEL